MDEEEEEEDNTEEEAWDWDWGLVVIRQFFVDDGLHRDNVSWWLPFR